MNPGLYAFATDLSRSYTFCRLLNNAMRYLSFPVLSREAKAIAKARFERLLVSSRTESSVLGVLALYNSSTPLIIQHVLC